MSLEIQLSMSYILRNHEITPETAFSAEFILSLVGCFAQLSSFRVHHSHILLQLTGFPRDGNKYTRLHSSQNPDMNNSQPSAVDRRSVTDSENWRRKTLVFTLKPSHRCPALSSAPQCRIRGQMDESDSPHTKLLRRIPFILPLIEGGWKQLWLQRSGLHPCDGGSEVRLPRCPRIPEESFSLGWTGAPVQESPAPEVLLQTPNAATGYWQIQPKVKPNSSEQIIPRTVLLWWTLQNPPHPYQQPDS